MISGSPCTFRAVKNIARKLRFFGLSVWFQEAGASERWASALGFKVIFSEDDVSFVDWGKWKVRPRAVDLSF